MTKPSQIEVGYVRGVHGVHGAVKITLHDPDSQALRVGVVVDFRARGGGDSRLRAELLEVDGRSSKDGFRVRVQGVGTRELAESLKSHGVWIEREALPALADDEYYLADLVGSEVVHAHGGFALGRVEAVTSNGPQDLLEICWKSPRGKKCRWLLPTVPGLVINVQPGCVTVDPPLEMMHEQLEQWLDEHRQGASAQDAPQSPNSSSQGNLDTGSETGSDSSSDAEPGHE